MKKILITGAAGFIGSHVCETLIGEGHSVYGYDNFDSYYPRALKEANLAGIRTAQSFRLIEGDIRDKLLLAETISTVKPDVVVHLAARAGVRPSLEQPELYAQVNIDATVSLFELCRINGAKKIVFASSSSVYGDRNGRPFRESDNTDHPLSPYGSTKKAGEIIAHVYSHLYGFSIACLRFFTVYGPRQRPDLAIRKFVQRALQDEPIPVFGDGSSRRDYTHVSDIVRGILGAIGWTERSDGLYGIFNLGSSSPIELRELLAGIEAGVGRQLKIERLPKQPGDVYQTFADTSLAERELGFRHDVPFGDGLRDFIEWMKRNG
ncbi:MAG: GDP-mannose 4,6-dehydratase [bacterium]|nr:GDP-mannose 4,6-dehydratase [bacterium]